MANTIADLALSQRTGLIAGQNLFSEKGAVVRRRLRRLFSFISIREENHFLQSGTFHVKYCTAVIILTACFAIPLCAQFFPYTFQTWDVKNGLSANYCNTIAQDKQGYLYVGTSNGLYVFNGSNFKNILQDTSSQKLSEGNVEDIVIDGRNRIWFASLESGVGMIDLDEGGRRIRYFSPPDINADLKGGKGDDPKVSKLCFDSNGYLWVGTRGNGLFKLDTATQKFTYIKTENSNSFYNKHIRSLFLYKPDTLFVGLVNGLSIVIPLNDSVSHVMMRFSGVENSIRPTVRKVLPWSADSFLLATDRGTFWLNMKNRNLSAVDANPSKKIDFRLVNSNDIIRYSEDEIWIATEDDGILFYNMRTGKFNYSYKLSEFNSGVPRGFTGHFYKGADGNIWIAHQNGLSLFRAQNMWFNNFLYPENRLLTGTLVSDGRQLLCFKANAVTIIHTETGEVQIRNIPIPVKGIVVHCHAINYSPDNYMLLVDEDFYLLQKKTLQPQRLPLNKDALDSAIFKHFRIIKSIVDTINGKEQLLLLARIPEGNILLRYYPASGDLTSFVPPGFHNDDFRNGFTNIMKAGNGKYWISTLYNGLIYVDEAGSTIQYASTQQRVGRQIPEGAIRDFTLTTANDLWLVIHKKGLVHISLDQTNIRYFEIFAEHHGLTDNRLYTIVNDAKQNLWLTGNAGIFCFLTEQKEFLKYTADNGLGNIKFHVYDVNMVAMPDGYIGIFEQIGNTTWFRQEGNIHEKRAKLVLNNIQVNGQLLNVKALANTLLLSPDQNNISFLYDIIDFNKTSFYEVLYSLGEAGSPWHTAYGSNELQYVQLPPGDYTFKMKLRYANGNFSPEQTIRFSIATVWYNTWWFRLVIVLSGLGFAYVLIRDYIGRRLYRQKKEMELQNAVAMERARISTELHDDLGSGLSTIRILSQTNDGHSSLEKISGHSKELLQKMAEIVWALNNENDTLDQLISYIRLQSATFLDSASITCTFDIPEALPPVTVTGSNRRHIQLMVKEAVHNIIKHAGASLVHFTIHAADDLVITIQDNGNGMTTGDLDKIAANGIQNMKKHTEAVNGNLHIESGAGVAVVFSIPVHSLSH